MALVKDSGPTPGVFSNSFFRYAFSAQLFRGCAIHTIASVFRLIF
jgi:hypothetical protein